MRNSALKAELSGAAHYQGNGGTSISAPSVQTTAPFLGEVKARGNGEGFATLECWLGDSDLLFLRRDRAEPVIVLPWRIWARPLNATTRNPLLAPLASLPSASLRPAAGAVVTHDAREIGLTLYAESGALATVVLDPGRAVRVASELIGAALPKVRSRVRSRTNTRAREAGKVRTPVLNVGVPFALLKASVTRPSRITPPGAISREPGFARKA